MNERAKHPSRRYSKDRGSGYGYVGNAPDSPSGEGRRHSKALTAAPSSPLPGIHPRHRDV